MPFLVRFEILRNFLFSVCDRKQKIRNHPNEKRHNNTNNLDILVFICANSRRNRPPPPIGKKSWSWALLSSSPVGDGQNKAILAAVWSMSALSVLAILSTHFEMAVIVFPLLRFGWNFVNLSAESGSLRTSGLRVANTRALGAPECKRRSVSCFLFGSAHGCTKST